MIKRTKLLIVLALGLFQYLVSKFSITATYASIYTFTPELFPTVIRNTAMGFCSMIARFGGMAASIFMLYLVKDFFLLI